MFIYHIKQMRYLHTFSLGVSLQAGIALTEEQWGVVRANAVSISAALAAHDATFELPLGSERRMQVPVPPSVHASGQTCASIPWCGMHACEQS